ncbi:MAG: MBOAT family O-acyltransferase [Candidatus Omnitrophota bacterium]
MFFNSVDFIIFFSAVFAFFFVIPHRFRWLYLLSASLFFYGYLKPVFLVFLVAPIALVYVIGLKIAAIPASPESKKKRKHFLWLGLASALTALVVCRYTDFIYGTFASLAGFDFKPLKFLVPIGLSFYSFKMVSYLIDVYNENAPAEKHFGYFALYVSFFPQVFSGPIDRAVHFIPELKKNVHFDMDRIIAGLQLIAWGIFKKMVIADRLGIFVDEIFRNPHQQGLNILMAAYFYAFQIYCDFSGYTDIAIGVSKMLGFNSMKNFDFPYFSKSITQFWNRWHISLSTWLRDYLFLPIAYAVMRPIKTDQLCRIKTETWGYVTGMMCTMLIAGLWHGPNWTFVVWGMLHGLYLIIGYTTKKARKKFVKTIRLNKFPGLHRALSIFITFNLLSLAWIFFRAESLQQAFAYLHYLQLKPSGKGTAYLMFNLLIVTIFILLEVLVKNRKKIKVFDRIPDVVKVAGFALFICLILIFAVDKANEFIYFQF